MPDKPIKQDYKIFVLADRGYVWSFIYTSRMYEIGEFVKANTLTPTGSIILQITRRLFLISGSLFTIFFDNYFTSILLFR